MLFPPPDVGSTTLVVLLPAGFETVHRESAFEFFLKSLRFTSVQRIRHADAAIFCDLKTNQNVFELFIISAYVDVWSVSN